MRHEIPVNDLNVAGSREWGEAFGRIRDKFLNTLQQRLKEYSVSDHRECDSKGTPCDSLVEDHVQYLHHCIDDGIAVAYAICGGDKDNVLWVCAADGLRRQPHWPCPDDQVIVQDGHFGASAVKRKRRALPVDEQYIGEAEQELGVVFPASYKAKMAEANGGELRIGRTLFVLFPVFDKSNRKSIRRTAENVVTESARSCSRPKFPNDGIAIASDQQDADRLVFTRGEDGRLGSEVYRWTDRTGKIKKVADDFSDLEDA